ncbi:MAG: 50S ribosomal protein L13 [Planctomycetes bacterium]|nr:50S ribosomal protein L13 [Planctomycetota bacterium]
MKTTYNAKPSEVAHAWVHYDATDAVLGRLAVDIARRLMGKHRAIYTPHVDTGDFVVVTHCEKVKVTGRKAEQKVYRHHTGYIGHLRELTYERVMERHPERILSLAVRRMMPKTKLGRKMFSKLKVYAGAEHPHEAQKPETVTL